MPAEFDPYYTWLGIPPEEQPPHHYRLLGIRRLEADRDVITHAMDQRMAHLRTLQGGRHSEYSQRLLNEVSAAAVVLLDAEKKASYDASLTAQLVPASIKAPDPVPPPVTASVTPPPIGGSIQSIPTPVLAAVAIAGGIAILLVVVVTVAAVWVWNQPDRIAKADSSQAAPSERERAALPPPEAQSRAEVSSPAKAPPMPPVAEPENAVDPGSSTTTPDPPAAVEPIPSTPPPASTIPVEPTPAVAASAETDPPPLLSPSAEEIEAARGKVVEIFGDEARQAVRPEQKAALAQRMLQIAQESKSEPAVKYAVLDAARRLLAAAGEVDLALATTLSLAEEFGEDASELQIATFSAMSEAPLPADKRDRLSAALLTLVDQAVAEEEFAAAEEFAKLAVKVSSRTSDASLRRSIVQKRSELTRLKDLFAVIEQAREKLTADARDPAANLVIGKFLCFVVADFEQGVPHLALSGREPFVATASADQAALPGAPDAVVTAGDAWYALAESVRSSDKELVQGALLRARHWYEQALPQLSGLDKARVEKRIQETSGVPAAPRSETSDSGKSAAKSKGKKGKRKTKGSSAAQGHAGPGLIGRGTADNQDVGILFTYQPGHRFTSDEIAELQNHLGAGRRQVEFIGVLSLSANAEVAVHHAGGSASGGVLYLLIDGKEAHAVGDDRTKDETITLPLAKGDHAIRWLLTGGELGSPQLEFSINSAATKLNPTLDVFYSRQQGAAARAPSVRRQLDFGKN